MHSNMVYNTHVSNECGLNVHGNNGLPWQLVSKSIDVAHITYLTWKNQDLSIQHFHLNKRIWDIYA